MLFGRRWSTAAPADADAFTAEALDHLDALYGTARRLTRDADEAQDLVQETYLKALGARGRFVAGTNLKAWLFTILHNAWRNRLRTRARARVEADSERLQLVADQGGAGLSAEPDTPETLLIRAAIRDDLRAALDELPDTFRETVWLRDVEELSYQEIAAALDIPVGTVMSRLSRGRKQLHAALVAGRRATPV